MNRFPIVKLAERYARMQTSGRLLSNRAAIDVLESRILQLADRIDQNERPERLVKLQKAWEEFQDARRRDAQGEMNVAARKINALFEEVMHDYLAWEQLLQVIDLRAKVIEREVKTIRALKAILTAEDARELVAKILSVILRVFHDEPRKLKQVEFEIVKMIGDSPVDIAPDARYDVSSVIDTRSSPVDGEAEEE